VRGGEDLIDPVRGPAVDRRPSTVSGPAGRCPATRTATGRRSPCRRPIPRRVCRGTAPMSPWTCRRGRTSSLGLTISDDPSRQYRALLFVNGWQVGDYVNYKGPQHSFPVPNGILNPDGTNSIAIAVWNLDGSTGRAGPGLAHQTTAVTRPRWRVRAELQPALRPRASTRCPSRRARPSTSGCPNDVQAGQDVHGHGHGDRAGRRPRTRLASPRSLNLPGGWTAGPAQPGVGQRGASRRLGRVHLGRSRRPSGQLGSGLGPSPRLSITCRRARPASNSDERIIRSVPPPPPAGTDAVSDLPFLSATNGWGPVERATPATVRQAAGDGPPDHHQRPSPTPRASVPTRSATWRSTSAGTARGSPPWPASTTRPERGGHGDLQCGRRRQDPGGRPRPSAGTSRPRRSTSTSPAPRSWTSSSETARADGNGNDHGDWGHADPHLHVTDPRTRCAQGIAAGAAAPARSALTRPGVWWPRMSGAARQPGTMAVRMASASADIWR